MKKKSNLFNKIYKILKGIITAFLVLILVMIIIQRVSENNFAIGGMRIFSIVSKSMTPDYNVGDVLILKEVPGEEIKVGDRVTYKGKELNLKGLTITHEVTDKREEDGKYYFVTKGIANDLHDPEISEDDIYGKVIYKTIIFSFFGRLMSNKVLYYIIFMLFVASISYQVIVNVILNKEVKKDEKNN